MTDFSRPEVWRHNPPDPFEPHEPVINPDNGIRYGGSGGAWSTFLDSINDQRPTKAAHRDRR